MIGELVIGLDTPALVVDLEVYRDNVGRARDYVAARGISLRSNVSVHCCPALAQFENEDLADEPAIAVSTLTEAAAFAQAGFRDVLIRNHVTDADGVNRVASLARLGTVHVTVDSLANARALASAACAAAVTVPVLILLKTESGWCGVGNVSTAVALAADVSRMRGLTFAGLIARVHIPPGAGDDDTSASRIRSAASRFGSTRRALARVHLNPERTVLDLVGSYNAMADTSLGVSEVVLDKYGLMDANSARSSPTLGFAARILSTVTSRPTPSRAIVDAGQKALSSDRGLPVVHSHPDALAVGLAAEHGRLKLGRQSMAELTIGSRVWLIPADVAVTMPLYDKIYASMRGRLVGVWAVAARGEHS